MSAEHQAFYGMCSLIESSHKTLKDRGHEDIANPGKRSGRGFAFHYVAAALAAATTNLRKIASFFVQDYERSIEPKRRTRRRKTLTGMPLARTEPPAAAPPA